MERTLSIIKPDAVERDLIQKIKDEFLNNSFKIVNERKIHKTRGGKIL